MKSIIMPWLARLISSHLARKIKHVCAESFSKMKGEWPCLEVYLHPRDPYSHLLLQVLPKLKSRYGIQIRIFWLTELEADMFPEPDLLQQYAYKDCKYLAKQYQLKPPVCMQLSEAQQHHAACFLQAIANNQENSLTQIVDTSLTLLLELSDNQKISDKHNPASDTEIVANHQRLKKQGHYGPGMVYFAGEWYWGLDRQHHLESRLNNLGLNLESAEVVFDQHLTLPGNLAKTSFENKTLTLYWSARSPYSYLALMRCCDLAKQYQFNLEVKPVMPMVMRNLPVPKAKKMYIFKDTKREANRLGIDYGFVADPLGAAVVRCYSLLDYARQKNRYFEFLLSFSKAVNAEGIRAQTDKGLKLIVERAGLDWEDAQIHLKSDSPKSKAWQSETQANLRNMTDKGLWGVPSIEFENQMVWGQDRLPYIMQLMLRGGD